MQDALEAVRSALIKRWPDSKVHLFGSTANQLSICNNNDIDVCLELPDLPSDAVRPDPYTCMLFCCVPDPLCLHKAFQSKHALLNHGCHCLRVCRRLVKQESTK